jgi:protein-tyrosine phosphatase
MIAYLMYKFHYTFQEALEYVQKKRPIVEPNEGFRNQLLRWEEYLQQKAKSSDIPLSGLPQ